MFKNDKSARFRISAKAYREIGTFAFYKISPKTIFLIMRMSIKHGASVGVFLLLVALSNDSGETVISQKKMAQLLGTTRKTIGQSVSYLIGNGYVAGAKIGSRGINSYVINPSLIWVYGNDEHRNRVADRVPFVSDTILVSNGDLAFLKQFLSYRKSSQKAIKDHHVTCSLIEHYRVNAEGKYVHQVIKKLDLNMARTQSASVNYSFAVSELHLTGRQRAVAKYIIKNINPHTLTMKHATNRDIRKQLRKKYINIGYVTISKTMKILQNENLITRKNGTVSISEALIDNSKAPDIQKGAKETNDINQMLMNRRERNDAE